MENLFVFTLVPSGLKVTNVGVTPNVDCGIYTFGSTIEYDGSRYILKDGNDSVIFTPYEVYQFINGRIFFFFEDEEAILEAFKGVLGSGVTDGHSNNFTINSDVLDAYGGYFSSFNSVFDTINFIDYTDSIANIDYGADNNYCKSINLYADYIYNDFDVTYCPFLKSVTLPRQFSNAYGYDCPSLEEVYLYNGYSLRPGSDIDFNGCNLSQESVDRILQACVNGNYYSKNLYLNNGNNAEPSGAGYNNLYILTSRGWSVYVN
jgi:hypothetical protein